MTFSSVTTRSCPTSVYLFLLPYAIPPVFRRSPLCFISCFYSVCKSRDFGILWKFTNCCIQHTYLSITNAKIEMLFSYKPQLWRIRTFRNKRNIFCRISPCCRKIVEKKFYAQDGKQPKKQMKKKKDWITIAKSAKSRKNRVIVDLIRIMYHFFGGELPTSRLLESFRRHPATDENATYIMKYTAKYFK